MQFAIGMRFLCILLFAGLLTPHFAFGGGTVKGNVTFQGEPPPAEKFVFQSSPNSSFCSKHPDTSDEGRRRVINSVETTSTGGLKHAIVFLQGLEDKNWMAGHESTDIDIRLCDFLPRTAIVVDGKSVRVVNHDADPEDPKAEKGVAHTVRAYEVLKPRSVSLFSVGLPTKGSELKKQVELGMWKKGSFVRLTCDQHEWMRSFLLPVQNPFFGLVNDNGTFTIENVPSGRHVIAAWHPQAGKVEQTIEMTEGGSVEVNFAFQRK